MQGGANLSALAASLYCSLGREGAVRATGRRVSQLAQSGTRGDADLMGEARNRPCSWRELPSQAEAALSEHPSQVPAAVYVPVENQPTEKGRAWLPSWNR